MPKQDKDNLENFFQKAVRNPNTAYSESDWEKLEAMLEEEERKFLPVYWHRWRILIASVGAILFLGGSYFIYSKQNTFSTILVKAKTQQKSGIQMNSAITHTVNETENKSQMPAKTNSVRKEKGVLADNTHRLIDKIIRKDENIKGRMVVTAQTILPETAETGTHTNETMVNSGELENKMMSADNRERHFTKANIVSTILRIKSDTMPAATSINQVRPLVMKNKGLPASRWSILFSYALEYTGIGYNLATSPGTVFGVRAQYHFTDRLSLSTGILKNNMKYWYSGSDFLPYRNYWRNNTNGIIPDRIKGLCSILEIPLMLHYKVADRNKSRFFVAAGVSSYVILDEAYQYIFANPNPGSKDGWTTTNNSHFIFSSVNASVGYSYTIFPGMDIGVEPYVKIPTVGIGWPAIKLYSVGASATFRYHIPKKKQSVFSMHDPGPN